MDIVIAAVAKIAEYTVGPVGQWLCYSCHYKSNMENLKNQVTTLRDARSRVQHDVEAVSNNGNEIHDDVKRWLTRVDDILDRLSFEKLDGGEEEAESRNSNASCLNLKQRHQISREAKKLVGNIAELLKNGKFDRVAYGPPLQNMAPEQNDRHPPSQNMVPVQNEGYITWGSRMSVMKGVMEALGDANIKKIGVWGSPGVGKSTLMKEIFGKAKDESLFDEVALVNMSDIPNLSEIQRRIAYMLGLKLDTNIPEIGRKDALRARLEEDKEKKVLVILDDIWKRLDLEEIGITPSGRCKVLLTSRDRHVLSSEMGIEENTFELDILGEQEAWILFEKMVGDTVKGDLELRNAAIEVAKVCAGLPIALVTVSSALKNQKNLRIWRDALVQLTRPTLEHDTKIWSPIYKCIHLSYKHLGGEELRSLFLLCAQQGYNISYRNLLIYGFGLCLFLNIYTLEDARNRLERLVRDLQDACLLLQSPHSSEEFYMHDVVRHVATIIASNDHMFVMRGNGGRRAWPDVEALKRCKALSILGEEHIHEYPKKIECPELRYFHVQCKARYRNMGHIPDISFQGMDQLEGNFFQRMEKLKVLSLRNMQLSSLFPLTNLQTLCLDGCMLGDIHWIGELKTLLILSLARSDISNLPREIESLTRLQLLDLSYCFRLRVIPPNVLSSLVNLEELYMREIDVHWEVEGPSSEGKNASLAELKKLSHLITLEIDILDANNLPKDLFSEKLERYKICIGDIFNLLEEEEEEEEAFSRTLKLKLNMSCQLDFGIKMLLKKIEYLYLDGSNSTKSVLCELNREDFQKLKHLHIQNNGDIKHILELRTPAVAFPILETFVLKDMIGLEEICQGNRTLASFKNLKVLEVAKCEKLRFIFSSSIARGLSLLEVLNITRCDNLGAIFVKEEDGIEDQGDMMLFGRLQTLMLMDLPKLVGFLSTKDSVMGDCRETISEGNHDLQSPLLHHDQVSFPSLQTLCMKGLPKIKHVWSCGQEPKTVLTGLEQLQVLEIEDCGVEEIVALERGGEAVAIRTLVFPHVTKLKFRNLQKLRWFYKGLHVSKWPMLKEMKIERCEKVEIFAAEVVSFEKAVKDQRQFEMSIKQPLFSVNELSFSSLMKLDISGMDKLEMVWQDQVAATSFPNIPNANNLPANFFFEKLERYRICIGVHSYHGNFMREVALSRVLKLKLNLSFQLDVGIKMLMKRTEYLYLDEENSSKSVLYEVDREDFQQLKHLHIQNNDNIKHILELRTPAVAFPVLETFVLENMFSLEEICQGNLLLASFKNLKVLEVAKCEKLKFIFSSSIARGLSLLEELNIRRCDNLGAIFVKEEEDGIEDQGDMMLFGRLQTLVLKDLPMLVGFLSTKDSVMADCRETNSEGNHDLLHHDQLSFPSLKTLHIEKMDKLEIIWPDQVTARSFPNIQELRISNCDKLLHVFQSNLHTTRTLIQSLTSLHIIDCDSLESIFRNMEGQNGKESQVLIAPSFGLEESIAREEETTRHIEFPTLTKMSLVGLPKLKWILEGVHTNLECPSLKQLKLGGFGRVINMIWPSKFSRSSSSQENQLQTCVQQPIFEFDEGTFPNLEHLSLNFSGRTKCPSRFSDLPACPSFPIIRLPTLLELEVRSSGWEEIFSHELVDREIRLSQLSLNHLPMLIHLWKEDSTQPCPLFHNLEFLSLSQCGKLKNLVPSSVSLHNLTFLFISSCHGLINLLPSSTAKTLAQLRSMSVIDCKRITEIVAKEDGEANVAITFNKLTNLTLDGLPNLTHFCSGPYSFGFPSLEKVIVSCPEMKTFCHGVSSTPKLKRVYDAHRWDLEPNFHQEDDLNTTTRCLWESNQYDTQWLFRERVENSEEDEDHP